MLPLVAVTIQDVVDQIAASRRSPPALLAKNVELEPALLLFRHCEESAGFRSNRTTNNCFDELNLRIAFHMRLRRRKNAPRNDKPYGALTTKLSNSTVTGSLLKLIATRPISPDAKSGSVTSARSVPLA